jgi:hypothetical protein
MSSGRAKRERREARQEGAPIEQSPATGAPPAAPEKRFKTRGTDWWTPAPGTPLNAGIPYVVQIAEDGLSLTEFRIFRFITHPDNTSKNDTGVRGSVCDPGGYTAIARAVGVCRKTVYNAIASLKVKGLIREHQLITRGKQRIKTIYFALHFGDVLPAWRANPELFKTNADPARVVAIGRRKTLATMPVARSMNMNPDRAPLRGCGRGRSEFAQAKRAAKIAATKNAVTGNAASAAPPLPLPSEAAISAVYEALARCCEPVIADALAVCEAVAGEARRLGGGEIPPEAIARAVMDLAHDYKPTPQYPRPTPRYFVKRVPAKIGNWVKYPEARARTG